MADENQADDTTEEKPAAKGGKKRLVLLIVLGLVIVAISVGGTLLGIKMLAPQPNDTAQTDLDPAEAPPKPAIYYPIKPPITASYSVRGRQRYLQAELTLMMREGDVLSAIELHQPMLRNALLMLISGATYDELQTAEGKELLRQRCLQEIQRLLEREIGKPGVEQVLFTNFVMQ